MPSSFKLIIVLVVLVLAKTASAVLCPDPPAAYGISAIDPTSGAVLRQTWLADHEVRPRFEANARKTVSQNPGPRLEEMPWVLHHPDGPPADGIHQVGIVHRDAPDKIVARFPVRVEVKPSEVPDFRYTLTLIYGGMFYDYQEKLEAGGGALTPVRSGDLARFDAAESDDGSRILYVVGHGRVASFDARGKKIADFRAQLAGGYSELASGGGVQITADRVFFLGSEVYAFDRATGRYLWSHWPGFKRMNLASWNIELAPDGAVLLPVNPEIPLTVERGLMIQRFPAEATTEEEKAARFADSVELAKVHGERWIQIRLKEQLDTPGVIPASIRERVRKPIESDWPDVRSTRHLAVYCLNRLTANEGAVSRLSAWKVLREIAAGGRPTDSLRMDGPDMRPYDKTGNEVEYLDPGEKTDLFQLAVQTAGTGPANEQLAAAHILALPEMVERLEDADLDALIFHTDAEVWQVGLGIWLKLGRWREAIEKIRTRSPEDQVAAIPIIYPRWYGTGAAPRLSAGRATIGESFTSEWGEIDADEEAFLFENFRRAPFATAAHVAVTFASRKQPFPARFVDLAREVLRRESQEPSNWEKAWLPLTDLLRFLAGVEDDSDNALFLEFLHHSYKHVGRIGSRPKAGGKPGERERYRSFVFPGREAAAKVLKERGIPVPPEIEIRGNEVIEE